MHHHAGVDNVSLDDLPTSNDPTTVLAHCPSTTSCLPVTVLPIPGEGELARDLFSAPRIFVAHQGSGRRWYQLGGRTRALRTAPRMIEIYEGGLTFDHCSWQGDAGRSVLLQFTDVDVQAITHGELQSLDLRTQHELFDERVSGMSLELAEEALHGLPNGRLYAQGLCVALIGVLASHHVKGGESLPPAATGRLGTLQQRRLADLIEHDAGSDLSLTRLAQEVGLSPYHFLRAFKATFGTTPHRYVQRRRMEAAAAALQRQGSRSVADIALEHGFASQAHMTHLMRRHLGVTPGVLKRRG
jgi:AraC family transcriptional regulator